jgi:hypothetical protein
LVDRPANVWLELFAFAEQHAKACWNTLSGREANAPSKTDGQFWEILLGPLVAVCQGKFG